jgi:hypothetical protein
MMLVTLWLQHSYFLGASRAIRHSYENMCMMVDRNAETQRQRQMERLEREETENTPRGGDSEGEPLLGTPLVAKAVLIREKEEERCGGGDQEDGKMVPEVKSAETIHTRKENRKGHHKATAAETKVTDGPFSSPDKTHHGKSEQKTSARKAKGHKTRSSDKKHCEDKDEEEVGEEEDYINVHTAATVLSINTEEVKYVKKDM